MIDLIKDVIFNNPDILLKRDFIVDCFSVNTHQTLSEIPKDKLYIGKIYREGKKVMIHLEDKDDVVATSKQPYLTFKDELTLPAKTLKNNPTAIKTTLGRLVLNHALLSLPFGDIIAYVNEKWNSKVIEKQIVDALLAGKINTESVYKYVDHVYFLGNYSDFCVPALTAKSITVDKAILKKKKELMTRYKDQLDDPAVMMKIESTLIAMDKKSLEGDDSTGFMIEDKNYSTHRKRMFLNIGMVSTFGDEHAGYNFIESNLDQGWDLNEIDAIANEIRSGIYMRGKETAKGGAISKSLGRTFQESVISTTDCKTKRTIPVEITSYNKDKFVYRNIMEGSKLVELTPENIGNYVGKVIQLRSPMTCAANPGYCYTCVDTRFKLTGASILNVQVMKIGSQLMLDSMKAMHVTKVSKFELESLDEFIV